MTGRLFFFECIVSGEWPDRKKARKKKPPKGLFAPRSPFGRSSTAIGKGLDSQGEFQLKVLLNQLLEDLV